MTLSPKDSTPHLDALLEHSGWVRQLARAISSTQELAEEVEQEAWRIALERPPKHTGNLQAWWTRVVRSTLHQRYRSETRHQKRVDRFAEGAPTSHETVPLDLAEQMEDAAWFAQTVKELPPLLGEAIHLRYYQCLSIAEIAQRLGIAQTAVKSRLRRGLEQLRNRFQQHHGSDWRARCLALAGPLPSAATSVSLTGLVLMSNIVRVPAILIAVVLGAYWLMDSEPVEPVEKELVTSLAAPQQTATPAARAEGQRIEQVQSTQPLTVEEGNAIIGSNDAVFDSRLRITIENADGTPFVGHQIRLASTPTGKLAEEWMTPNGAGVIEVACQSGPWELYLNSARPSSDNCLRFSEGLLVKEGELAEIRLQHPGATSLLAKVIDHQDQPVAGVAVRYHGTSTAHRGWIFRHPMLTELDGTAAFDGILGDGVLQIITANNFQQLDYEEIDAKRGDRPWVCRLPELRLITLRVIGADGQALTGGSVFGDAYIESNRFAEALHGLRRVHLGAIPADGKLIVEAPMDSIFPLQINHQELGEISTSIPPKVTNFEYRVDAGETLKGKVVDTSGNPIPEAEVRVWAMDPDQSASNWSPFSSTKLISRTESDGQFAVPGLASCPNAIVAVAADGYAFLALQDIPIPYPEEELTITLEEEQIISGTVVDANNSPMEDVFIRISGPQVFDGQNQWTSLPAMFQKSFAKTGPDGKFTFRGLTSETWTLETGSTNHGLAPVTTQVVGGTEDLVLVIEEVDPNSLNLDCTLLNERGEPVHSNVKASLEFAERSRNGVRSSGQAVSTRTTVPQVVARALEVDEYVLEVKAPGYAKSYLKIPGIAGHHQHTLVLQAAVPAKIQINRPQGKKLYLTTIKAFAADGTLFPNSRTYGRNLLQGSADPGLRSGAYGWLEMTVPANGGYFEVTAEEGSLPVRIEFSPEIAECDSQSPFVIELDH